MDTKPHLKTQATELDTNSTPNAPNYSSVQQTPADETPQVPEVLSWSSATPPKNATSALIS